MLTISDFPKEEYFCAPIWTALIRMIPLTNLVFTSARRRAVFDRLRDVNTEKSIKPPARRANQFSSSFATVSYSAGVIATSVLVRIADQGSDIAPCLTTAIAGR